MSPDEGDRPGAGDQPGRPGRGERPEYRVYRAGRGPLDRFRPRDQWSQLRERQRRERGGRDGERSPGGDGDRAPRTRRRFVRWALIALAAWLALSLLLFVLSTETAPHVSGATREALTGRGSLLTGANVLVIGSDKRSRQTAEPGSGGPSRSDTLLLLHVSPGSVRKLSVLRDSKAPIPAVGDGKINAAYANGGAALTVRTIEAFLGNGLHVDHVIEVSFEDFPQFIDAVGGIDVGLKRCISSQPFGGRRFRLRRGTHHLNGRQALAFSRVRKNACSPNEDDRARAARQQLVLSQIRNQLLPWHSPSVLVRLPWVAWAAPRTLRTDLHSPGLFALFADMMSGGSGKTDVLKPYAIEPGTNNLLISDEAKRAAVRRLEGR